MQEILKKGNSIDKEIEDYQKKNATVKRQIKEIVRILGHVNELERELREGGYIK